MACVDADRRLARKLPEPQSLVDGANAIELLPRRGHQGLLLRLHDLRPQACRDAMTWVGIQFLKPWRRLRRLERLARRVPASVQWGRDDADGIRLAEQRGWRID